MTQKNGCEHEINWFHFYLIVSISKGECNFFFSKKVCGNRRRKRLPSKENVEGIEKTFTVRKENYLLTQTQKITIEQPKNRVILRYAVKVLAHELTNNFVFHGCKIFAINVVPAAS